MNNCKKECKHAQNVYFVNTVWCEKYNDYVDDKGTKILKRTYLDDILCRFERKWQEMGKCPYKKLKNE